MIKEAINRILELRNVEDTDSELTIYGNYSEKIVEAKFNNTDGSFRINNESVLRRTVSTIKSLTTAILEESRRRENATGNNMTVLFTQKGGNFYLNDDFYSGEYTFLRTLSQQWKVLAGITGKTLDHENFLLALQELSPSIVDFKKLYRQFIKVRIIGNSELTSNPVFVDNEAESGYKVKYNLSTGQNDEETIPEGFILNIPYSKGSDKTYDVPVETMILNNGSNELVIRINCPILERIEELAIFEEVAQLREDTKNLTDLLILESY